MCEAEIKLRKMYMWFKKNYPEATLKYDQERIKELRKKVF